MKSPKPGRKNIMNKGNKNKGQKVLIPNPLEALKNNIRDIGSETAKQMRDEAAKIPGDFMEQLLGFRPGPKNFSGEIVPGEAVEISEVFSGKYEEIKKVKNEISFERRLLQEE